MRSQSDDDILGFDMDGARGSQQQQLRSGDGFSSAMQPGDLDDRYGDDVTGLGDEPDPGLPPLVSLQGRGPSQPMSMNHTQGITVSLDVPLVYINSLMFTFGLGLTAYTLKNESDNA